MGVGGRKLDGGMDGVITAQMKEKMRTTPAAAQVKRGKCSSRVFSSPRKILFLGDLYE